ncbi:MAG: phosphopantothenate/pantothenate synthetase [Candidatus Diapherotrites archaeon]
MKIPKKHPRSKSLIERHKIEEGMKMGIVTPTGMVAQGRGEAFDYLLGERTVAPARGAISAAAALFLLSDFPVISVNGNTTVLCGKEIVALSKALSCPIEVNLFYRSRKREKLIEKEFRKLGVKILGVDARKKLKGLESKRAMVDSKGIWKSDAVLVMLEDGDRTEALRRNGKKVVAIDLNPLSRTAKKANISIVDNCTRAVSLLTKEIRKLKKKKNPELRRIIKGFNNNRNLKQCVNLIRKGI